MRPFFLPPRGCSLNKIEWIMGLDEVGRGPLAGPVVAACALMEFIHPLSEDEALNETLWLKSFEVTDSKKCSAKKRQSILETLQLCITAQDSIFKQNLNSLPAKISSLSIAVGECSEVEIDQLNILHASMEAMKRAMINCITQRKLDVHQGLVLVDGNRLPENMPTNARAIVKGDLREPIIGLASLGAKVYRDSLMNQLDGLYPEYGFAKHAGYPTPFHLEALALHGVSPSHRKSFKPVRAHLE